MLPTLYLLCGVRVYNVMMHYIKAVGRPYIIERFLLYFFPVIDTFFHTVVNEIKIHSSNH